MADDTDYERIAAKAHELWEAEGHPHGRDREHWDAAKEIIALQDSLADTLLPRDTGAEEPVEEKSIALDNEGEAPNLTDTGEHDLTSTDREPAVTAPHTAAMAAPAVGKTGAPTTSQSASILPASRIAAMSSTAAEAPAASAPAAPASKVMPKAATDSGNRKSEKVKPRGKAAGSKRNGRK